MLVKGLLVLAVFSANALYASAAGNPVFKAGECGVDVKDKPWGELVRVKNDALKAALLNSTCVESATIELFKPANKVQKRRMRAILRYLARSADESGPLIENIPADLLSSMGEDQCTQFVAAFTRRGGFKGDISKPLADPVKGNEDRLITNLTAEQLEKIHFTCLDNDDIKELLTTKYMEYEDLFLLDFCSTALSDLGEKLQMNDKLAGALSGKGRKAWIKNVDCTKIDSAQLHPGRGITPFSRAATKQISGECFMKLKNFGDLTEKQIKEGASDHAFAYVDKSLVPLDMYTWLTKEQVENFDLWKEESISRKPDELLKVCEFLHPLALERTYDDSEDAEDDMVAPRLRPHCVNGLLAAIPSDKKASYKFAAEILNKPKNVDMFSKITKDGFAALDVNDLIAKSNQLQHFTSIVANVFGPQAADSDIAKLCKRVTDLVINGAKFESVPEEDVARLPIRCLYVPVSEGPGFFAFDASQVQYFNDVLDGTSDADSNIILTKLLYNPTFAENVSVEQFERLKKTMFRRKEDFGFAASDTPDDFFFLPLSALVDLNKSILETITSNGLKTILENSEFSSAAFKKFPPRAFRSIGDYTLEDVILKNMTADQLAQFDADIPDDDPTKCKSLKLHLVNPDEIYELKSHSVNGTCFKNLLENNYSPQEPLFVVAKFAKVAGEDLFDKLEFEHLQRIKLHELSGSYIMHLYEDSIWDGAQPAHLLRLLEIIKGHKLSNVAAYGVSHAFRAQNGVELVKDKVKWHEYPVTFLLNEKVLESLGSKFIASLDRPLADRYAYMLFSSGIARKHLNKDQFETIMSDNDYAACAKYEAKLLYGLNKKVLETVHHRCISKLKSWQYFKNAKEVRAVIPYLSETAFASFRQSLSQAATELLSPAQLSHFGEQDDFKRCKFLDLQHVSFGNGISARCFDTAVNKKPLTRKFFHAAPDDIFAEVTAPATLNAVLSDGEHWSFLRQKQFEGLLALQDGIMCRSIKVPDAGMSLQLPPNFGPDCIEAMEATELEKLLASDTIHRLDPNILSGLTSKHEIAAATLASLASRRAALLPALGRTALPSICEHYKVQEAPQFGIALKHLSTECLRAFHGIAAITSSDAFLKLPPPLQGVVHADQLVARINFGSIRPETLARLASAENICQHFPADKLRKVKDWLVHVKAKCISALSFPLTPEELAQVNVSDVTPDFVRQYCKQLSRDQVGKLTTNAQGIALLGDLSVEQVAALTAAAVPHIPPSAFASVDAPRLTAFSPDAIAAIKLEQAAQMDKHILSRLTSKQAPRLQPAVASLLDAEIRASMDPEIVQLLPQSGAMSILASMRTAMAVLVTLVLALWVV